MSDPEHIWLQPECCCDGDRLWCEDNAFDDCDDGAKATEYVRADLFAAQGEELAIAHDMVGQKSEQYIAARKDADAARSELSAARARIERLEKVLKPVSKYGDNWEAAASDNMQVGQHIHLTLGDLRAARKEMEG